jgi:hypothetical protein
MIDEERLEQISRFGFVMEGTGEETFEILRLIRLGQWAEKHAVPALQMTSKVCDRLQMLGETYASVRKIECDDDDYDPRIARDTADLALEELPKDNK